MPRDSAQDVPAYRRFMPALMPTRTESAVYFDQQVRTQQAEHFLAATREAHPELHPTFFHLVLWAMAQMFDRHPRLNRFVAGGRLYQRDGIWISFTAKTALSEEGTLVEVKHRFDPREPFADLVGELQQETTQARSGAHGLADRELELFLHLPPRARRGVVRLASLANAWRLLPPRVRRWRSVLRQCVRDQPGKRRSRLCLSPPLRVRNDPDLLPRWARSTTPSSSMTAGPRSRESRR